MNITALHGSPGLSQIIEGNPVATLVIDAQHRVTHWNKACALLTGLSASDMVGTRDQWRAFYGEQRPIMADLIVDGAMEKDIYQFYYGKFRPSAIIEGAYEAEDFFPNFGPQGRWLYFTATAIRNEAGAIIGAIETLQDITERRQAESALQDKENYLSQIVDGSAVATLVIDRDHRVSHWNHACAALTGTSAKAVIGTRDQWRAFYPKQRPIMADLVLDNASEQIVDQHYHGRYHPSALIPGGFEAEDFFPHFGQDGRWLFFTAAPLRNARGEVIGAIETLQDVTARRRAEEALKQSEERYRQLSLTDSLTGLFNSRHLREQLDAEIERTQRYHRPLSLFVIDADHFKRINDTYGHLEGDKVLQKLAEVLLQCLRKTDYAFRYGGEEFVVLMPDTPMESAAIIGERIRDSFARQAIMSENGEAIRCTISLGATQCRPDDTAYDLIARADQATYQAKDAGRNRLVALL